MVVKGIEFNSIIECCKYFNVPYGTIMQAVYRGKDLEQAIDDKLKREIVIDNKRYNSYKSLCDSYGINVNRLREELKKEKYTSDNIKDAVEAVIEIEKKIKDKSLKVSIVNELTNEIEEVNLREACTILGINYNTAYSRVKRDGLTPQEAIEGGIRSIEFNGFKYNNLKEACIELSCSYCTVRMKIKNGMSVDEAIRSSSYDPNI